jgi:hypothetical protein
MGREAHSGTAHSASLRSRDSGSRSYLFQLDALSTADTGGPDKIRRTGVVREKAASESNPALVGSAMSDLLSVAACQADQPVPPQSIPAPLECRSLHGSHYITHVLTRSGDPVPGSACDDRVDGIRERTGWSAGGHSGGRWSSHAP